MRAVRWIKKSRVGRDLRKRKLNDWEIQSGGSLWDKKMNVLRRIFFCVCGCSLICSYDSSVFFA